MWYGRADIAGKVRKGGNVGKRFAYGVVSQAIHSLSQSDGRII